MVRTVTPKRPLLNQARIRNGSGPEIMTALRNAAVGSLRLTGATNIAETIRRNASQVRALFTKLGVLNQ